LFILGAAMACSGLVALWKEASPLRRAITLVATALMLGIVSTQWHRALTEAWQ